MGHMKNDVNFERVTYVVLSMAYEARCICRVYQFAADVEES